MGLQADPRCCTRIIQMRGDVLPGVLPSEALQKAWLWMVEFTRTLGWVQPVLLSGGRTAAWQRELQRRWDSGEREGIAARPVDGDKSKHVAGRDGVYRAFDLANGTEWLRIVGPRLVKDLPFMEWGGSYLPPDIPHFEERKGR